MGKSVRSKVLGISEGRHHGKLCDAVIIGKHVRTMILQFNFFLFIEDNILIYLASEPIHSQSIHVGRVNWLIICHRLLLTATTKKNKTIILEGKKKIFFKALYTFKTKKIERTIQGFSKKF